MLYCCIAYLATSLIYTGRCSCIDCHYANEFVSQPYTIVWVFFLLFFLRKIISLPSASSRRNTANYYIFVQLHIYIPTVRAYQILLCLSFALHLRRGI